MKKLTVFIASLVIGLAACAQSPVKVYDETIDPNVQITEAVTRAKGEGKYVVAQLGGNWCKWCIRFAKFVNGDPELKNLVDENFEFIHVNYNPRNPEASTVDDGSTKEMLRRLGNPVRFGYPVLIVLDSDGNVIHTQDSSFLESGEGYDKDKVMRFFKAWTPSAVASSKN